MISESRIPIIIVSYRNPRDVAACVTALSRLAADPPFDVYVCENGGSTALEALMFALAEADGPCERDVVNPIGDRMSRFTRIQYLRLRGRDARVAIAEARENLGYAGAVNAWIEVLLTLDNWSGLWILNPDALPEPHALAGLVEWSLARRLGMVGSRLVTPAQPEIIATRGLQWRRVRASTKAVDNLMAAAIEPDPAEVEARLDAPSGSSMYVTRRCLQQVGLMDERYFLYFEDLDWGYRAKNCCRIGYAHRSVVLHPRGTTIGSSVSRSAASAFSIYLEFRNRINFVRHHHRAWLAWTMLILAVRSFEYAAAGAFTNMRAALYGLKAGVAGELGRPDRVFEFDGSTPRWRKRPQTASYDFNSPSSTYPAPCRKVSGGRRWHIRKKS